MLVYLHAALCGYVFCFETQSLARLFRHFYSTEILKIQPVFPDKQGGFFLPNSSSMLHTSMRTYYVLVPIISLMDMLKDTYTHTS